MDPLGHNVVDQTVEMGRRGGAIGTGRLPSASVHRYLRVAAWAREKAAAVPRHMAYPQVG